MMSAGAAVARAGSSAAGGWLGALERTARIGQQPWRTLPRVIDELGERHGEAPALIGERGRLSHAGLAALCRRYARWALAQGLGPGAAVGLMLPNGPDTMAAWLGLSRVGVRVALLNTHLTGAGLAHCIAAASPSHLIVGPELRAACEGAAPHLAERPRLLWADDLAGALEALDPGPFAAAEERGVTLADTALYIYTSGTTGLPKAARVSHHRVMTWSHWFAGLNATGATDRLYSCLPMYHSVGGVVAPGSVIVGGGAAVLRERFSARRFWDDVVAERCTIIQYIGELCRYLLNAPAHPLERAHALRLATGNGLRPEIWEAFQARFAIPRILEFYAATEGTLSLCNVEGRVGAVGRVPPFLAHSSPAALVRHDPETGAPARGPDGLCLRCPPGEAGELIGRLAREVGSQRFEGYTSKAASEAKVLRDVFAPGDAWFRTGDLMRVDRQGFYSFVDRVGDTFRWKGENVATTEVAAALARAPGVTEAVVYGVAVPGTEGRAGMAALTVAEGFELAGLRAHLAAELPAYARPLFLRLCRDFEITETFKQKKQALVEAGFDPARTGDPLYFDDAAQGAYVPLDAELHGRIVGGDVRV
ncbi:AMP-dependent synthetase and ligase [Methylobacterium sp. 4-46]|uniref:long-chain-acyl-CoA synthetase n=1 Tax=unclassified Methylobacterium TaxID=2615210 RepID=UPI000152C233|nr:MULTISPECIES: long-chain-acyl-CoA synthetase [Methylobacterium]ACA18661.1 AMP-dependent synthetase and ligase [Methylobacterium sp. 4-46]WFT77898.1 long-chain-acyl-CoA synthetase [Methylobacterium nodulans]